MASTAKYCIDQLVFNPDSIGFRAICSVCALLAVSATGRECISLGEAIFCNASPFNAHLGHRLCHHHARQLYSPSGDYLLFSGWLVGRCDRCLLGSPFHDIGNHCLHHATYNDVVFIAGNSAFGRDVSWRNCLLYHCNTRRKSTFSNDASELHADP